MLLVLPLILMATGILYKDAIGPYFLFYNFDPDYAYLMNALNIAYGEGVGHADHPGTPMQVFGTVVLKLYHLVELSGGEDLRTSVLRNPEQYLYIINRALLALNVIILYCLGIAACYCTNNILMSLTLQLSPFMSGTILLFLSRVTPEPLLLSASLIMIILILLLLKTREPKKIRVLALTFSVVSGFGLATKITFLPLLLIPLVVLPRISMKLVYLLGVAVSFFFFTLPIVEHYPKFLNWVERIIYHKGRYGHGGEGLIDADKIVPNLKTLYSQQHLFFIVFFLAVLVISASLSHRRLRASALKSVHLKILAGVVLCNFVGLAMVVKHFAQHYLLPSLCLSGLGIVLILLFIQDCWKAGARWINAFLLVSIAAICIYSAGHVRKELKYFSKRR
jgi:hypothetical protein